MPTARRRTHGSTANHGRSQPEFVFEPEAAQTRGAPTGHRGPAGRRSRRSPRFPRHVRLPAHQIAERDRWRMVVVRRVVCPIRNRTHPDPVLAQICSRPTECSVTAAFAGYDPLDLHQLLDVRCAADTAYLFVAVKYLSEPQIVMAFETGDLTLGQRQRWVADGTSTLEHLADLVHALIGRLRRTGSDLADRLDTEEALCESETRFRQAFEGANTGICLVAIDRMLLEVNGSLACLWGYQPDELVGRTIASLHHADEDVDGPDHFELLLRGDVSPATFSRKYRRSDGSAVTADVSVSLVSSPAASRTTSTTNSAAFSATQSCSHANSTTRPRRAIARRSSGQPCAPPTSRPNFSRSPGTRTTPTGKSICRS